MDLDASTRIMYEMSNLTNSNKNVPEETENDEESEVSEEEINRDSQSFTDENAKQNSDDEDTENVI